ncbi:radical SAM protein [Patescibacteria group bacterium]|nr:radical SAM protein [Patescibacteria group bacterium]
MNKVILPVQIYFGLTYRCNLNCEHCYVDKIRHKEKSTSEIKKIIKKLSDNGVMKIYFSHGESLLRNDIEKIIDYCSEKGIYTILLSNGILLTEEMAKKIKDAGIGKITISLDSLDFKYHDKMRRLKGSAKAAVEAMDICRKNNIKFSINTTINKSSVLDLKKFVEFAITKKANDIFFLTIHPELNNNFNKLKIIKNYNEIIEEIWRLKMNFFNKITVSFHDPLSIKILKNKIDKKYIPMLVRENICNAGRLWGSILPTGEVQPCNFLPISIGNAYKDSFNKIWNRDNLNNKVHFSIPLPCKKCEVSNSCRGGCKSFVNAGKINSRDFRCIL